MEQFEISKNFSQDFSALFFIYSSKISNQQMMKFNFNYLFIILISTSTCFSQALTPQQFGFNHYTIENKDLGSVNYYVTSNKIDQEKPILLYLDGSGSLPLFQQIKKGYGSTVAIDYKGLSEKYHVILISKPGVPFIDKVKMNYELGYPEYDEPEEYTKKTFFRVEGKLRKFNH